jgi:hypothetical protein
MAKTAISSAMGVGKSRKASELRRKLLGGPSALLVDPLGFDAGDSNLYRYVNNGPTAGADPNGLEFGPGAINCPQNFQAFCNTMMPNCTLGNQWKLAAPVWATQPNLQFNGPLGYSIGNSNLYQGDKKAKLGVTIQKGFTLRRDLGEEESFNKIQFDFVVSGGSLQPKDASPIKLRLEGQMRKDFTLSIGMTRGEDIAWNHGLITIRTEKYVLPGTRVKLQLEVPVVPTGEQGPTYVKSKEVTITLESPKKN